MNKFMNSKTISKIINKNYTNLENKIDDINDDLSIQLYRVGIPRITETTNRFNCGRSTGGIGTGIYAYYSLYAAKKDSNYIKGEQQIYKISNLINNPLFLTSEKESYKLNDLGKYMRCKDMLAIHTIIDFNDIPSLKKQLYKSMITISEKETIDKYYREWMLDYINISIELSDKCTLNHTKNHIIVDGINYTTIVGSKNCSQPINYLLQFIGIDSVIPYGKLSNSNSMGCVILKETVDKYLRKKTVGNEDILDIGIKI